MLTGPAGPVAFGVGVLLLGFSPIIRGGNRHVALIFLELLALALLLALGWKALQASKEPRPLSMPVLFLAFSPLWVALVQLVPVPPLVWAALPGREVYLQALASAQISMETWRPLSLVPDATWVAVLAGLPPAAAFLLAHLATRQQLALILRAIVLFTFAQAILGLLQFSLFKGLYFDAVTAGRAIGSFANPNHFASYIAMSLPLTILFLRRTLHAEPTNVQRGRGGHSAGQYVLSAFWGSVLFMQLAAILASLSRAGLGVGLLAAFAAILLLPLKKLSRRSWWMRVAGVTALCALVAATVGVDGLVARTAGSVLEDGRWLLVEGTWQAALAFWPFGAGLGSYAGVFPRFQPSEISGFADYAHNDFLQLLMECGLLFVILAGVALILCIQRVRAISRRLRMHPADPVAVLQASCGLGLLAALLHALVEFNFRIPANAVLAAFLLGAFLRYPTPAIVRGSTGTC